MFDSDKYLKTEIQIILKNNGVFLSCQISFFEMIYKIGCVKVYLKVPFYEFVVCSYATLRIIIHMRLSFNDWWSCLKIYLCLKIWKWNWPILTNKMVWYDNFLLVPDIWSEFWTWFFFFQKISKIMNCSSVTSILIANKLSHMKRRNFLKECPGQNLQLDTTFMPFLLSYRKNIIIQN